ncbi:DUF5327 family protein [Staphylococcus taiwanensis]|nr:DUF5327 family protein [Staphylococcus taiwanensis]
MNKEQIIQLIEQELVQADEAVDDQQFEKHMYTIHTLTSLFANAGGRMPLRQTKKHDFTDTVSSGSSFSKNNHIANSQGTSSTNTQKSSKVTAAEIEAMGGKVPNTMKSSQHNQLPSNTMVTDDEIGNGESIFDF